MTMLTLVSVGTAEIVAVTVVDRPDGTVAGALIVMRAEPTEPVGSGGEARTVGAPTGSGACTVACALVGSTSAVAATAATAAMIPWVRRPPRVRVGTANGSVSSRSDRATLADVVWCASSTTTTSARERTG
jgi:hypothetical protein